MLKTLTTAVLWVVLSASLLHASRAMATPALEAQWSALNAQATDAHSRGAFAEAAAATERALEIARRTFGPRDPRTLTTLSRLGSLYDLQGRHGEAETVQREALGVMEQVLGPTHIDTLRTMNNLAVTYARQGRHGEAEALLRKLLQLRRDALGPEHSNTLATSLGLAGILSLQGRDAEAEPLYRETLQTLNRTAPPGDRVRLTTMDNLATTYRNQGRLSEAEALYSEVLRIRRSTVGERHPDTLTTLNNLAGVHHDQRQWESSQALYGLAARIGREILGDAHPRTLSFEISLAVSLAESGRFREAVDQLRAVEPRLLSWVGNELYSTEAPSVRRQLLNSQSTFQNLAINLALTPGAGQAAVDFAAQTVLRFKSVAAEEEAFLARLTRQGGDPRLRALAEEIASLRRALSRLYASGAAPDMGQAAALGSRLAARELELARVSKAYAGGLQARAASVADLRQALQGRTALLEVREYRAYELSQRRRGERRWAGFLLTRDRQIVVRDLGTSEEAARQAQVLLQVAPGGNAEASRGLYRQLLAPFDAEFVHLDTLYVAPDGALHLIPFQALRNGNRHLTEALDVRLVQTGRDLLREVSGPTGGGLVALGGLDFLAPLSNQAGIDRGAASTNSGAATTIRDVRAELRDGFASLPHSAEEVEAIGRLYALRRPSEPRPIVLTGRSGTRANLFALRSPRVLHLATHGFYRAAAEPADRPLLLSGVALAGANRTSPAGVSDGVLLALEALDLELNGTELVVLSACETARGQIDYGEGVSGLVRALRTAGARHVLVALRPVDDHGARLFMETFYRHWLAQPPGASDPAAALRAAQREWIAAPPPEAEQQRGGTPATPRRAQDQAPDATWSSFVLVGGR